MRRIYDGVLSLTIAGIFGGISWYLVRRYLKDEKSEVDEAVWSGDGSLGFRRCLTTSVISEVVIGMGASLGREAAPKLMGGVSGSLPRAGLDSLLHSVAFSSCAGAGRVWRLSTTCHSVGHCLPRRSSAAASPSRPSCPPVACSWIATATAWLYLPNRATYVDIPAYHFTLSLFVWALLVGPVIGLISSGYIRVIGWVSHHRASGRRILVAFPSRPRARAARHRVSAAIRQREGHGALDFPG